MYAAPENAADDSHGTFVESNQTQPSIRISRTVF
jgi:hypothetical protein